MAKLVYWGVFLLLQARAGAPTHFNGAWWFAQTERSRASFASGYQDCSFTRPGRPLNGNQYDVANYITAFYQAHPAASGKPIANILQQGGPPPRKAPPPKGGETYSGPHGYYDGEFWGEADKPGRLAFVQGDLVCEQAHGRAVRLDLASDYADYITRWFDADNGSSRLAIARAALPIAKALAEAAQAPHGRPGAP